MYTFDSDAPSSLGDMVDSEKFESYMVSPKIQESCNAYEKGMPWKSKTHAVLLKSRETLDENEK